MRSQEWTYHHGQLALEGVRLDQADARLLADGHVLDLDEPLLADRLREVADELLLLGAGLRRLCRFRQRELAEGLLELLADALERRLRLGGDHRADELEREPDRARLERRQAGRAPERVPEELLVDAHLVSVERGVDRVAAAAEVDEVQKLQVVVELVVGDVEAVDELLCRDRRPRLVAAAGEQVGEERLQDAEALGRERAGGALELLRLGQRLRPRRLRRLALVPFDDTVEPGSDFVHELGGCDRPCAPLLA